MHYYYICVYYHVVHLVSHSLQLYSDLMSINLFVLINFIIKICIYNILALCGTKLFNVNLHGI